jgi:quercetin dioxygenase-like cupin family protein
MNFIDLSLRPRVKIPAPEFTGIFYAVKRLHFYEMDAILQVSDLMAAKKAGEESLIGRPVNLAGLVEYQEGSVVSREVLNKKTGTITIFSFDEGEGLSEHVAPFDATVVILDGEAEITIEGKPNRVKAGQFIIMPGGKPHALKAITRYKMLLIMIRS